MVTVSITVTVSVTVTVSWCGEQNCDRGHNTIGKIAIQGPQDA